MEATFQRSQRTRGTVSDGGTSRTFDHDVGPSLCTQLARHGQFADRPTSYSALSKKADQILANAKRRLNVSLRRPRFLDDAVSHERHFQICVERFHIFRPSTTTTRLPNILATSSGQLLNVQGAAVGSTSHARMPSDTSSTRSVHTPTLSGAETASLRSSPVRARPIRQSSRDLLRNQDLEPVMEDATARDVTEQLSAPPVRDQLTPSQRHSLARELRSQAEDLKDRLSMISAQARDDSIRRRSVHGFDPVAEDNETTILEEVHELEQSLEAQEEVIDQLEQGEDPDEISDVEFSGADARAEWRDVLDQRRQASDEEDDDDMSRWIPTRTTTTTTTLTFQIS
ncbi:hypothetical protein MRB53_037364 [Persea americana]|nr:hypothetical protein MRB53_037364 [Persea americana]